MKRWIQHPAVRIAQALVALGVAAGAWAIHRRAHQALGNEFALSVWGQLQDPDGRWRGVDLLAHPKAAADRFQVVVTPLGRARVKVVQLGPGGTRALYPPAGESGVLAGGRSWSLPEAGAAFPHEGGLALEVTVAPLEDGEVGPAQAFGAPGLEAVRLADGRSQVVTSRLYRAAHGARVELGD